MRVCLAPKARCIYLGNDSHLDWQGVCMYVYVPHVCVFVGHTVQRRMLWRLDFCLADWLPGRGASLLIYLLAKTQQSLLFSFSLRLSSPHRFLFFLFLLSTLASPASSFPASIISPCFASKAAFLLIQKKHIAHMIDFHRHRSMILSRWTHTYSHTLSHVYTHRCLSHTVSLLQTAC